MVSRKGTTLQAAEEVVHQKVLYQGASLLAPQAEQDEYRALALAPFSPARMTFSAASSVVPHTANKWRALAPEGSIFIDPSFLQTVCRVFSVENR
jgi:hypothetical protein